MIKNLYKKFIFSIMTLEARMVLAITRPRVIAITGTIGKTTTKDLIYAVLASSLEVRKNVKSYNSAIGVPLTILGLDSAWSSPLGWLVNTLKGSQVVIKCLINPSSYPKFLVLEVGADHPGDIGNIVSWLRPEMGLLTGIGNEVPVHVEFFPNIEAVIVEKSKLLKSLPSNGTAFINHDDARAWGVRDCTKASVVSYGLGPGCEIKGSNLNIAYDNSGLPMGMSLRVDHNGKSVPIRLMGVLGGGSAAASMAAIAVALRMGINFVDIAEALQAHKFASGRMRLLKGLNNCMLIDDTYNSSPSAVRMALDTLHELNLEPKVPSNNAGRKIAVLGAMLELGLHSESEHKKVGEWLRGVVDVVVCVGPLGRAIGESALADGCEKRQVHFFATAIEAGEFLKAFVRSGDVVLLKASQSVRLEQATKMLLADPSQASKLLVRQEREWLDR